MKSRSVTETAIICVSGVIAIAFVFGFFAGTTPPGGGGSKGSVMIVLLGVIGLAIVLMFRYLTTARRAKFELTGDTQYRQLAEEYRRLADLAITAQEHTDLKLGDVGVRIEYLSEQMASLQKILKEVE